MAWGIQINTPSIPEAISNISGDMEDASGDGIKKMSTRKTTDFDDFPTPGHNRV